MGGESFLEITHDAPALIRRGVNRHQVVVMQVHSPSTHLAEQAHQLDRRKNLPHRLTERIATRIPHGPQAEGKLVLGLGLKFIAGHHSPQIIVHAFCNS